MQARARRRELFHLPVIDGYFDDQEHFKRIKCVPERELGDGVVS